MKQRERGKVAMMKKAVVALSVLYSALMFLSPLPAGGSEGVISSMKGGKGAFEKKCRLCHSLQLALGKAKGREAWIQTVKRMVMYGAPLKAGERNDVVAYLSARSTFERNCARCHEPTRVVPDNDVQRDWQEILKRMSGHLAELEKKEPGSSGGSMTSGDREEIAAFLTVILGGD